MRCEIRQRLIHRLDEFQCDIQDMRFVPLLVRIEPFAVIVLLELLKKCNRLRPNPRVA